MSVQAYSYQGCKELEDVLSLLKNLAVALKAGQSVDAALMAQLGAAVALVPELGALPADASGELQQVLASASLRLSEIALVLLGKYSASA